MTDEQIKAYVAGLLEERRQYLQAGKQDRADQVTAELRRVGAEAAPPKARAEKRPAQKVETRSLTSPKPTSEPSP